MPALSLNLVCSAFCSGSKLPSSARVSRPADPAGFPGVKIGVACFDTTKTPGAIGALIPAPPGIFSVSLLLTLVIVTEKVVLPSVVEPRALPAMMPNCKTPAAIAVARLPFNLVRMLSSGSQF